MRLPRILNQCHPIPGFVYGQASFAENEQAVLIPVRPRKRSAAICSGCHQPASGYDQSPTPRRFEFIGFWGYVVFLVYRMRRVNCKQCGVLVEEVPWGMGKRAAIRISRARSTSLKAHALSMRRPLDSVNVKMLCACSGATSSFTFTNPATLRFAAAFRLDRCR
jgi:hypothetical protein